jgi:ARD/ARD' family
MGTTQRFRSHWLLGIPGHPGAIHIQAPAEQVQSASLLDKNRQPHRHDSARISLITQGEAVLHLLRPDASGRPQRLDCPVREGDLIVWPAWITHTFDALNGFWLVSAMSNYVAPTADGFLTGPDPSVPSLDSLVPISYRHHLSTLDEAPIR